MAKFKEFLKTTLLGGLGVLLPTMIIVLVFTGLFRYIGGKLNPLSELLFGNVVIPDTLADIITALIIILACFLVGVIVKTRVGKGIFRFIEREMLRKIPGYSIVNETISHFTTAKKTPFSKVAVIRPFDSGALLTGFITDEHPDHSYTVFVPTGPNPTSGNILHLAGENVFIVDVSVEEAMKSIIGCGAGSSKIMRSYRKKYQTG